MAKRRTNTKARSTLAAKKAKQEQRIRSKNVFAITAFSIAGAVFLLLLTAAVIRQFPAPEPEPEIYSDGEQTVWLSPKAHSPPALPTAFCTRVHIPSIQRTPALL